MLPAAASVMTQAISWPRAVNAASTAARSLYGSTIVSAAEDAGHPGLSGSPNVATPEPGRREQRVDVAVVAAGELHDDAPPGEPAGQPDRGHRRLGPAVDQAHLLRRRCARRSPRPARPRSRTACRTRSRGSPPPGPPRPPTGGRARGSSAPTSRSGRRSRRPSTSVSHGPAALAMNRGVPPTARKARTGELTPPGMTASARSRRAAEAGASSGYDGRSVCVEVTRALSQAWLRVRS